MNVPKEVYEEVKTQVLKETEVMRRNNRVISVSGERIDLQVLADDTITVMVDRSNL